MFNYKQIMPGKAWWSEIFSTNNSTNIINNNKPVASFYYCFREE